MPREVGVDRALVLEPGRGSTIVTSLIDSVASVLNVGPTSLPPLQRTIDTDALVALLDPEEDAPVLEVQFEYAGCEVRVDRDGLIQIRKLSDDD